MYDELIGNLRAQATHFRFNDETSLLLCQAADAIEELSRLHEAQRQNLIALMNEEPEPKWIPCGERLPELHEEVLVCNEEYGLSELGFATVAVRDGTGWIETWERTAIHCVTHWMPLPQPPKEE